MSHQVAFSLPQNLTQTQFYRFVPAMITHVSFFFLCLFPDEQEYSAATKGTAAKGKRPTCYACPSSTMAIMASRV